MATRFPSDEWIKNCRRGLTRSDDRLPSLLQQPLSEGGTEGTVPDLATLLKGAYAEHGWDPVDGMPTDETLRALGMQDLDRS